MSWCFTVHLSICLPTVIQTGASQLTSHQLLQLLAFILLCCSQEVLRAKCLMSKLWNIISRLGWKISWWIPHEKFKFNCRVFIIRNNLENVFSVFIGFQETHRMFDYFLFAIFVSSFHYEATLMNKIRSGDVSRVVSTFSPTILAFQIWTISDESSNGNIFGLFTRN